MEIARIEGKTRTLGESQGYRGLHIRDENQFSAMIGEVPVMVSEWVPNEDERAAIAAGSSIFLHVQGTQHPPVLLEVLSERCPLTKEMFA